MEATLIFFFKDYCPTSLRAAALRVSKAGDDSADAPDLKLNVLALIMEVAIGMRPVGYGCSDPAG